MHKIRSLVAQGGRTARRPEGIGDGNVFYTLIRGMVVWMCTSGGAQNYMLTKCHFLNITKVDIFMQNQRKVLESTVIAQDLTVSLPDWVASGRPMDTSEPWFRALLMPGDNAHHTPGKEAGLQ